MPYEFDVFFSYKRNPLSDEWHERLKDKIAFWLEIDFGKKMEIFFDQEDIRTGARWRQKLASALKTSKCLVCIWSPNYFKSKYCVSEWTTFDKRGKDLDMELVVPARYFDGDRFPPAAKVIQSKSFEKYTSTISAFWTTERAVEFEETCIRPFARDVAAALNAAPPFSSDFQLVEAADELLLPEEMPIGRIGHG